MKVAVIGSGHAAISAAEGLIERGIKPVILDVGETLDPVIQKRVEALGAGPPDTWAEGADHFPSPQQAAKLPKKTVFGSEYIFAKDHEFAPMCLTGTTAVPSFAKGGFSMGWGGAVLPARPEDLGAWPIAADRLSAYYGDALKSMPITARNDGLAEAFPLPHDAIYPFQPTAQGARLLQDLERAEESLNRRGDRVLFGTARLAVDQENCVHCGMCLTGCPYGLIYALDKALERLIAADRVYYRSNTYVVSLEEAAGAVTVNWIDITTNSKHSDTFDRVFVGAGALSTARIMLNSLKAYDHTVIVKDSAKFAVPMLRLPSATFEWPATNTLADLFIEAVLPEISDHWLHIQISPLNELILQSLFLREGDEGRRLNGLGKLTKLLTSRLMVAWCASHSNLSSECELSISAGRDDLPVLNIRAGTARSAKYMRAYGRKLAKLGLRFGTFFATPATMLSPSCSTGHCGGSFPMRERPQSPFESDIHCRLKNWQRVHLVDSSAFPTIPGTTIALLIRANARRVVAEAQFSSSN